MNFTPVDEDHFGPLEARNLNGLRLAFLGCILFWALIFWAFA
jgi:hypothetical protein